MTTGTPAPLATSSDRWLSAIAYMGPLVVFPLLRRRKDRFLTYHTRQGLYLFVVCLSALLLTLGLLLVFRETVGERSIPFRIASVLLLLVAVGWLSASAALAYASARGRMPMLPVLGDLAGEG